jgi:large subunit ribosomal protein L21
VFAVIKTGGKQYKVQEGDILFIEKLDAADGAEYIFNEVLAISDGENFIAGAPLVEGSSVKATVVKNGKGKKIEIFKYKPKKNEKKKIGHRQPYTKVQIEKIVKA